MTLLVTFIAIVQTFAISLGVGSSTLAIVNFFVAIADGVIDDTERRMMGVVYIVLLVAMVLILATTVWFLLTEFSDTGTLSAFSWAELTVLIVLFTNALLMTAHLVPTTFGPALQAGSWYTLAVLAALVQFSYTDFSYLQFLMSYVTWLILAVGIVNGIMAILREKREGK